MSNALAVLTEETAEDVTEVIGRLANFVRDRRDGVAAEPNSIGVLGVLRAVQSEPQQRALDQLLVLGTLLEGHADHVMDAVGPAVVPSVATIRQRFDERRRRKQPPLQTGAAGALGYRREDEPVHAWQGVRRPRRRAGRHGAVQHHLVGTRNTAAANRNRRTAAMDRQGALGTLQTVVAAFGRRYVAADDRWCVALSGGPDSLALTAVAAKLQADHRIDRRPPTAAGFAPGRGHRPATGHVVGMR